MHCEGIENNVWVVGFQDEFCFWIVLLQGPQNYFWDIITSGTGKCLQLCGLQE